MQTNSVNVYFTNVINCAEVRDGTEAVENCLLWYDVIYYVEFG